MTLVSVRSGTFARVSEERDRRTAADSLCTRPCDPPRAFHFFVDGRRARSVRAEIEQAVSQTKGSMIDRAALHGEIFGQVRRAAAGKLRLGLDDGDLLEPVRRNPDLWEIKWKRGKRGEFRLYHAEPGNAPDLVGLRFHAKDTSSNDADQIERLQNAEMDEAGRRFVDGLKDRWGHAPGCHDCAAS